MDLRNNRGFLRALEDNRSTIGEGSFLELVDYLVGHQEPTGLVAEVLENNLLWVVDLVDKLVGFHEFAFLEDAAQRQRSMVLEAAGMIRFLKKVAPPEAWGNRKKVTRWTKEKIK